MDNRLLEKLHEHDMSVSDLSRKTGISRTTLTAIIKGRKNNLTFNKASTMAAVFGCSVSDIFPDLNERKTA